MELIIKRIGDNIIKTSDFSNPKDSGEVAHFIAELELAKLDLIELWENMQYDGEEE